MKMFAKIVKATAGLSLFALVATQEVAYAILLLVFSSMALGILIGEKIDGVSK